MAKIKRIDAFAEELKSQIDHLHNAATYVREKNVVRYQEAWNYYLGKMPLPLKGDKNLTYVEPVLYEAVQRLTPTLLNIFTENDSKAVAFRPRSAIKNDLVEIAVNKTINRIFLRENDGYKTLEDAFRECLITGDAFIKYFIEETHDDQKLQLSDWASLPQVLDQVGDEWEIDMPILVHTEGSKKGELLPANKVYTYKKMEWKIENVEQPQGGTHPMMFMKGTIILNYDNKALKIEQVDFKDLWFDDTQGSDIQKARYFAHRNVMTVGQAIAAGYKEETLQEASTLNILGDEPLDKNDVVVDSNPTFGSDDAFADVCPDPLERKICIWEHYLYSSIPTGKTKLYQVVATDNVILSVEPVSRIPFIHMQYETVPGSTWGRSLYDVCKNFQDEISHFARVMRQHASMSAFGRYQAVRNAYDRESLLNCRPGGVVEVQEIGNVQPMPIPELSPYVSEYLTRMRDSADRLTASATDAVPTADGAPQLAAASIAMMISQSEMKDKTAAKCIARTGIRPLFEGIYELMRDEGYVIVNADGSTITADDFPSVYDFTIDINTVNDDAIQVNGLMQVISTVAQTQKEVGGILTQENLYKISEFLCKQYGLDPEKFITDPASQQVDPQQQQEQMLQAAASKESGLLQLDAQKADIALKNAQTALVNIQMDELVKMNEATREREKEKSVREYQLMESQIALNNAKASTEGVKVQTQATAVNAEVQTGQNITGVRI